MSQLGSAASTFLNTIMIRKQQTSDIQNLIEQATHRDDPSWLMAAEQDAQRFLKENETAEWTFIYACFEHVYLHSILAPMERLIDKPDPRDLMESFPSPKDAWRINYSYSGGQKDDLRIFLEGPMANSPLLRGGEKLVFRRPWVGYGDADPRTEIKQRLVHCLELFYVKERNAFCRLDENGDFEDVIRLVHMRMDGFDPNTVVSIRRQELHKYATLADMGIVTHFDFNRYKRGHGWSNVQRFEKYSDSSLFYCGGVQSETGSYVIGRQVIIPTMAKDEIARRFVDRDQGHNDRGFVTFKVRDIRSGNVMEASCDPALLSNVINPNPDLPHELSAVFFRAEVLSKYKADTEKYRFTDHGEIYCRDSWRLRSHYVNDAGQVHAYLADINKLPYREQLYWLSFNENPKGDLARRAIINDFRGEVDAEYDPIHSLKLRVEELDSSGTDWWKPRGVELRRVIQPPVSDSTDEWAEAILSLDQLLVEGFVQKALRSRLADLGQSFEKTWRSLKLVEECLSGKGMHMAEAKEIVGPLRVVHQLRTVVKGHAAPRARTEAARMARKEYGTFRNHYRMLVAECDAALATIVSLIGLTE